VEDLEILVRKADFVAQCREGITQANAILWLDRGGQDLADFGLGAVSMLSGSYPQCAVYIVGQIAYC
jgi:hypothetical protein